MDNQPPFVSKMPEVTTETVINSQSSSLVTPSGIVTAEVEVIIMVRTKRHKTLFEKEESSGLLPVFRNSEALHMRRKASCGSNSDNTRPRMSIAFPRSLYFKTNGWGVSNLWECPRVESGRRNQILGLKERQRRGRTAHINDLTTFTTLLN